MKITEQTTFAELQEYLRVCGHPFVTLMAASNMQPTGMHAVIHTPHAGTFTGNGNTAAEALEDAFTAWRRATLPEGLKQYAEPEGESEHDQYDRATGDYGRPLPGTKP